jgi:CTP synthase
LIGKYVEMQDCYKSILAFIHAGASNETKVNIISIHSEYIDALNVEEN